jgi:myo-inositol-1(or 4)-monophosphatase
MDEFMTAAWEAAESAGTLIPESWQQTKQIHYKSAVELVTSVDRQSESRIVAVLRKRFPGHSILAEEETRITGAQGEYRWIIDPLDGTTNFAHGYPQVSISIALERNEEIIRGLVYDPLRRECFAAVKSQGASLNGSSIRISQVRELNKSLLATGFPYDRRENAEFYLAFFKAFLIPSQDIRRGGSAALDLCYVACGRLDGFWELKLHAWDTAAGSLIVREAGGALSTLSGNEFSIWGMETLASNGFIHHEMIRIATKVATSTER